MQSSAPSATSMSARSAKRGPSWVRVRVRVRGRVRVSAKSGPTSAVAGCAGRALSKTTLGQQAWLKRWRKPTKLALALSSPVDGTQTV
eukprot:scaffold63484_cov66-Phaeocystis_antarctica.AAC.3